MVRRRPDQTTQDEVRGRILTLRRDEMPLAHSCLILFYQHYGKVILIMNSANQLLHQLADLTLSSNKRAQSRCQLAKQLEEVGSYERAREMMGALWEGVGIHPNLEDLDQATAAEVLLRWGLTGWLGSAKRIEGAQEAAKNLISESLRVFEALENIKKVAEAQTEIAYCYWREGAYDNARVLLIEALSHLTDEDRELKAIALLRSAIVEKTANRYHDALRIHTEAAPLFEASENHALKGKFHNSFANVLKNLGSAEKREDYIDRALIEFAAASFHFGQAGHTRYQARVENNLGMLFCVAGKFAEAHEHLNRAQALFTSLKDQAHLAQVDGTRARVLLKEGHNTEAEKLSRSAVQTLQQDDQQALFAEALTTHGIALARLGQHQHARLALQRVIEVAQNVGDMEGAGLAALAIIEELGEHLTADDLSLTFENATDLLSASQHPGHKDRLLSCARRVLYLRGTLPTPPAWKGFSLKDALRRYESRIIECALKDSGEMVTRAARLLGFKNHNSLIKKLKNRHPHLLSERTPAKQRKGSLIFIRDTDIFAKPVTILRVEDHKVVAGAVKETLEMEGWRVETCRDGTSALKLLESSTRYDVMIVGSKLPGVVGVELIRRTRRLSHRQQIPLIMFSSSDIEGEARGAGANAFLRKPNDMSAIAETIARLLARKPRKKGK
jgi:CheY-like chemotaxis protein